MREVCLALGLSEEDAVIVADHLVDDELRGVVGMSRIFVVEHERERVRPRPVTPIRVEDRSGNIAVVDGGGHLGFVVAAEATRVVIEMARTSGLAAAAANSHRYAGTLAYYLEKVARAGFIGMAAASGSFRSVAPFGGREGLLDTNPIAFGFPTDGDPVVWDIATSAISGSEVARRRTTGQALPDGVALDRAGRPTTDAAAALEGTFRSWGGHKGSGLAIVVRLLALLGGVAAVPDFADPGAFFILAVDPGRFLPEGEFPRRAAELADQVRESLPVDPGVPVRMPYDRSLGERRRRRREGIVLDADVFVRLDAIRRAGRPDPEDR
jgi:LDH2 family malate/lactate/ureidoglycolate dehydrogenase